MHSKTRAKFILGGVALALVAACLLAIRLANHTLEAAGAKRLPCPDADYAWISNDDVMSFLTKQASVPTRYDPNTREDVVNISAEKTNIASGFNSALGDFSDQLLSAQSTDTEHWCVSPDGKRLIYGPFTADHDYEDETESLSIWTIASGDVLNVDPEVDVGISYFVKNIVWMPDNSLLLVAKNTDGEMAALYNTESEDDASVAIPLPVKAPTALGVTPDNRLIYADMTYPNPGGVTILEQDINQSQTPPRTFTPKLPTGATVKEIALSPTGDNLAWLTSSIYTPPGYRLVKRIFPQLATKMAPYPVLSIYLSSLDGIGMRLLGMESNPPNTPEEEIHNMRWRPDGKSLSFRWHSGIYMVPAE